MFGETHEIINSIISSRISMYHSMLCCTSAFYFNAVTLVQCFIVLRVSDQLLNIIILKYFSNIFSNLFCHFFDMEIRYF